MLRRRPIHVAAGCYVWFLISGLAAAQTEPSEPDPSARARPSTGARPGSAAGAPTAVARSGPGADTIRRVLVSVEQPDRLDGQGDVTGTSGMPPRFGDAAVLLPDLNGDGVPELAVGAPAEHVPHPDDASRLMDRAGRVYVADGATGEVAGAWSAPEPAARGTTAVGSNFGRRLFVAGDVVGDGRPDLAVALPDRAYLASSRSGRPIAALERPLSGEPASYPRGLALVGDHDDDGVRDVVVGDLPTAPDVEPGTPGHEIPAEPENNWLHLFSGADGDHLATVSTGEIGIRPMTELFGATPDGDGDGRPDLLVGGGLPQPTGVSGTELVPGAVVWLSSSLFEVPAGAGASKGRPAGGIDFARTYPPAPRAITDRHPAGRHP